MSTFEKLTHGWNGLKIGYCLLMVPMYITFWTFKFRWSAYFRVLPFSILLFIGAMIVTAIIQEFFNLKGLLGGLATFAVFSGTGIGFAFWARSHSLGAADRHVRGADIADGRSEQATTKKIKKKGDGLLTIAGVGIVEEDEAKHFKLIGVTGTGKSTAIVELMKGALERGDRAIFADPDAGYQGRFFDPARGDVILNPFDARSSTWDLFAEINEPYDVENLAHSLIAEGEGSSREWRGYARVFLAEVIRYCHANNIREMSEVWRLLAVAPNDELRPIVAGTPAQPFLDPDAARMFASIRSVCASGIGAFRYLQTQKGVALSVRQWIHSGRGVLFLPYNAGQIAALANVIATWIRIGIFETMNRGLQVASSQPPIWFVVDELDALGRINGLKDALARLRKFRGHCVLGFQSIAQVSATYGEDDAQTIVENCGNSLIMRCSSSKQGGTSEFASRLIGDREIERTKVTSSRSDPTLFSGKSGSSVGESVHQDRITERAVMPSELEQLPDLAGYLKFASYHRWMRVSFGHDA